MSTQAVAKTEAAGQATGMVEMIERLVMSPDVDVSKLERLLEMQERIIARQAKADFMAALAEMKPKLPVIDRKGRIEVREKTASGKRDGDLQQSTAFARWEDIDEAITPILHEHGFVLTFRTDATEDGRLIVTAVLSGHGHEERTSLPPLPFDTTGSKNNIQAVGSSLSYGKRYAATLLLNIRTKGEDDDGVKGDAKSVTDEQAETLKAKIVEAAADLPKFLKYFNVQHVEDIPAKRFDEAYRLLTKKAAREPKPETVAS